MDQVKLLFKKIIIYKYQVLLGAIFLMSLLFVNYLVLFKPSLLNKYYHSFRKTQPQTLKTVRGSFFGDYNVRVHKVRYRNKMYLNFRRSDNTVTSVSLKGSHNGFFEYWGDSLSLAFIDDNGDGVLEIIAPTFDSSFKPHLNVVFYNAETEQFKLKDNLRVPPQFK